MFTIDHGSAIELEYQVCRLFKCERAGVSGLAEASLFERRPIIAAIMIVSYIHAKKLHNSEKQYDEFLFKYDTIFSYPDENDAKNEVQNYIDELKEIIDSYLC